MLKQVREPGASRPLIQGPDVIPEVDGHQRQPVVFMGNYRETVWQRVFLKLDLGQLVRALRVGGDAQAHHEEKSQEAKMFAGSSLQANSPRISIEL